MHTPEAPDYTLSEFWVKLPDTDNLNTPAQKADVFFVHGTVLHSKSDVYYDPYNEEQRRLPLRPRMTHAGAYEKTCRVFQPHYRQVTMEAHLHGWDVVRDYYKIPFEDVKNAYYHFKQTWNKDRPLILAGNSQGSFVILALMKYLAAKNELPKNLVAAYLIGASVTQKDLDELGMHLCQSPTDLNCVIVYNTLAKGGRSGFTIFPGALCVNPLSWKNTEETADKSLHLGFMETKEDGTQFIHEHATNAWVDKKHGAVIVDIYDLETAPPREHFPKGDLHSYNYPLFFKNIEANVEERVNAYLAKTQKN